MSGPSRDDMIDALPAYVDRAVLALILARIDSSPSRVSELLQGLKELLPADGPHNMHDFSIGFRVEGDEVLSTLFDQLIKWR